MKTELALNFAREVIGWQDAASHHSGEYSIRQFAHQSGGRFYHGDISGTIQHVTNWCDENGTSLIMVYGNDSQPLWIVTIDGVEEGNDDLCTALMTACLNAHRDRAQEYKVMP